MNRVYAYLVAGMDPEARRVLDEALAAPPGGWDRADARLLAAIDRAGQEG